VHAANLDILSRDTRSFAAGLLMPGTPYATADLVASLIEEDDFAASLGATLYQIDRRIARESFSAPARELVNAALDLSNAAMTRLSLATPPPTPEDEAADQRALLDLRERCLRLGPEVSAGERGGMIALLGSVERAFSLVARIAAERRSVPREVAAAAPAPMPSASREAPGGAVPAPGDD
jgi:phosphate:Na+ symporter